MRETDYCDFLYAHVNPDRDAQVAGAVLAGLFEQLPDHLAATLTGEPLWSWTTGSPARMPQPDRVIGDAQDRVRAVIEMKSPGAAVQWTSRRAMRACRPTGFAAAKVHRHYLDPEASAAATDPTWDGAHEDGLGCGCLYWKMEKRSSRHFPVVHQCDAYAYTWDYLPPDLAVDPKVDPVFTFVDPGNKAKEFLHNLQTKKLWHVVSLPKAVDAWSKRRHEIPVLDDVVAVTRRFLGE